GSMGKVGAAGDNAAMESFFALLQKNVLDRKRWRIREELRIAIITWIERTYHRHRRQARLGRLTPIEYETIMNPTVSLAAYPQLTPARASVPFASARSRARAVRSTGPCSSEGPRAFRSRVAPC